MRTTNKNSNHGACHHRGDTASITLIAAIALGADDEALSAYHTTKRRADDFLSSLSLSSVIVQPSLVYGHGGASAELFDTLASLPLER